MYHRCDPKKQKKKKKKKEGERKRGKKKKKGNPKKDTKKKKKKKKKKKNEKKRKKPKKKKPTQKMKKKKKKKKNPANHMPDKGLLSRIYRNFENSTTKQPNKKWTKKLNSHFSTEDGQMAQRQVESFSPSPIPTEMQIKTTTREHLTLYDGYYHTNSKRVPWRCSGSRLQRCPCSGSGHCCGMDSIPGLGFNLLI